MTTNETPEFSAFLLQHAKGRAHDEATEQLRELVRAVVDTGKKGTLTLTLTVEPDKKVEGVVRVDDRVQTTIPKRTRASMWFTDSEGSLHRDDPAQTSAWDVKDSKLVDNPDARTEPIHGRED